MRSCWFKFWFYTWSSNWEMLFTEIFKLDFSGVNSWWKLNWMLIFSINDTCLTKSIVKWLLLLYEVSSVFCRSVSWKLLLVLVKSIRVPIPFKVIDRLLLGIVISTVPVVWSSVRPVFLPPITSHPCGLWIQIKMCLLFFFNSVFDTLSKIWVGSNII